MGERAARPKLEEVVQDTRTFIQSGRERLVIARTASPSTLPTERYRIQVRLLPLSRGMLMLMGV